MELERFCVKDTYTLREVIDAFGRREHGRVVLVIDSDEKVVGVLSQGDVLRALSEGKNMYSIVRDLTLPSYLYLFEKDLKKAYQIFKEKDITLLPIINKNRKLIDVIVTRDIYDYLEG